mmetsp:Transcript_60584/g.120040  ORF Transcript_60584/g.120040 Transcript_60584/m.120040 type:complete len:218 (+) Transcript_60584:824-1477(+)
MDSMGSLTSQHKRHESMASRPPRLAFSRASRNVSLRVLSSSPPLTSAAPARYHSTTSCSGQSPISRRRSRAASVHHTLCRLHLRARRWRARTCQSTTVRVLQQTSPVSALQRLRARPPPSMSNSTTTCCVASVMLTQVSTGELTLTSLMGSSTLQRPLLGNLVSHRRPMTCFLRWTSAKRPEQNSSSRSTPTAAARSPSKSSCSGPWCTSARKPMVS